MTVKDIVLGKTVWRESKRQTGWRPGCDHSGQATGWRPYPALFWPSPPCARCFPDGLRRIRRQHGGGPRPVPPGAAHYFGTDYFGRDIFSVVVYGARDSLLIGVASVLAGGLAGCIIGAAAGIAGGVIDLILMRFIEIVMTIPGILLALAIAAVLGPNLFNMISPSPSPWCRNRPRLPQPDHQCQRTGVHYGGPFDRHAGAAHLLPACAAQCLVAGAGHGDDRSGHVDLDRRGTQLSRTGSSRKFRIGGRCFRRAGDI